MRTRIILTLLGLVVALVTAACGAGAAATTGHGGTKVVAAFYPPPRKTLDSPRPPGLEFRSIGSLIR
jgi:ABC-type glycerol-3-phosphate transport system substrate-binding protein